jgi:hypothetical protein
MKHIGRSEREILAPVAYIDYLAESPPYMAFSTIATRAERTAGPLSPLLCQAWDDYGDFNAHHGEVRGCRRVCERTPVKGRRRFAAGGRLISLDL